MLSFFSFRLTTKLLKIPEHNQKEDEEPILPPGYGMCWGRFINIVCFFHYQNNKGVMTNVDDDHRPQDSAASRVSTVSSGMSLRKNSRILFCNTPPKKKMRTELQHVSDPAITGIVGIQPGKIPQKSRCLS